METSTHPYSRLTPDLVLDLVESKGFEVSGSQLALNSYENRVYQVGLVNGDYVVVKIYRPERLSDDAILEEHHYLFELKEEEIPVVAPVVDNKGDSLFHDAGFRFAIFPRVGGRFPEVDNPEVLYWLGRLLGRIHAIGAKKPFVHRPIISMERMLTTPYQFLMEQGFIPQLHQQQYQQLMDQIIEIVSQRISLATNFKQIRLHGDFHPGNILQRGDEIAIVDTDDCAMGPAIQDLWLLLSGENERVAMELMEVVEGYQEFYDFNPHEVVLIEPLRTMRIVHYSYWLARRWNDPAFPMHFPWFNSERYWDEQILTLREQLIRLNEEPVKLYP
jgi:Ser/Thr protein kinase RdoA (MazF antagonist)